MADDTNTAEREATYLCQAWGETDLPSAAIVRGLDAVRAFLVEQWLGDEDQEHDDGTKALPAAMADMQEQWELEGEAWKWSISFEIGGISVQRVDDVGRASLAASAGSEPVAWMDDGTTGVGTNSEHRVVTDATKQGMHKSLAASFSTPLYLHPSPPEGSAPAAPPMDGEIALIEKALERVGITSLLNHGAASCVFTEGCCGVSQEHILAYTREIALHCAVALGSPQEGMAGWKPIAEAQKTGHTLLLGYFNSANKWRTTRGQWMSQDYIDEYAKDPDFMEPGWHETTVEDDDGKCWPIEPTHWMPLPAPPLPASEAKEL